MDKCRHMLRVLIYGINYTPEPTGTGKYTGEMASWLATRGHEVHAIVSHPHYPRWQVDKQYGARGWFVETVEGVQVYRTPLYVPPAKKADAKRRILLETSFTLASLRWWLPLLLSQRTFDVAVAVGPPLQSAFMARLYCQLRNVPWVLHLQDLQVDAALQLGMLRADFFGRLLCSIEEILLRQATSVSTISETMRHRVLVKGVDQQKAFLFPNWADTDLIRPMEPSNALRESLGAAPGDVLVLYSGNMGEKQGLELIVKAAERLRSTRELKFALVGAGSARSRLAEMLQSKALDNLVLLDLFPQNMLPHLLAAGDIHLIVQRPEAADLVMPSKLCNVLAAGRPIIATAAEGTALFQLVAESGAGIVVPPADLEALVSAVQLLRSDRQARKRLGNCARLYAETYLQKDTILGAFESTLKDLVAKRRS